MNCHNFYFLFITLMLLITCIYALPVENIAGGEDADDKSFKYQVVIYRNNVDVCGGTIIGSQYILTAAHCVIDKNGDYYEQEYKVIAGIHDLRDISKNGVEVGVKKIFTTNMYSRDDFFDDIAVLKLNDKLPVWNNLLSLGNKNITKVTPAEGDRTYAGETAEIAGFGFNWAFVTDNDEEIGGNFDTHMKHIKVDILGSDECRIERKDSKSVRICGKSHESSDEEKRGTCNGDSGSGLVRKDTVIGVLVSSPLGCDESKEPAIYTRVSAYSWFIKQAKNDNYKNLFVYKIPAEMQFFLKKKK